MKKLFYYIFLPFSFLSATTINIPADYSTIQDGISASVDGDTVPSCIEDWVGEQDTSGCD